MNSWEHSKAICLTGWDGLGHRPLLRLEHRSRDTNKDLPISETSQTQPSDGTSATKADTPEDGIENNDDAASLAAKVLIEEHKIYPRAISWFIDGRLSLTNGKAILDNEILPAHGFQNGHI